MEKNEKSHPEEIPSTLPINSGSALEKAIPSVDIESLIYVIGMSRLCLTVIWLNYMALKPKFLIKPSNEISSVFRKISCFN